MRIYKLANKLLEFPNNIPDGKTESIRLKDGRIFFYKSSFGHWAVILPLKHMGITSDQFDAIGWLDSDGTWTTKVRGDNEIQQYMKHPGWNSIQ